MIKISDVSKIFNDKSGEVVALRGVNLEIGRGDIFGIIGMSGAGKSTLLRCLSTLETPTSGSITLDGTDLASLSGCLLYTSPRRKTLVGCAANSGFGAALIQAAPRTAGLALRNQVLRDIICQKSLSVSPMGA